MLPHCKICKLLRMPIYTDTVQAKSMKHFYCKLCQKTVPQEFLETFIDSKYHKHNKKRFFEKVLKGSIKKIPN